MRNRKIQRMVRKGEITHAQGVAIAAKKKEETISYYNSERYADPTAYHAVRNLIKN